MRYRDAEDFSDAGSFKRPARLLEGRPRGSNIVDKNDISTGDFFLFRDLKTLF